MTGDDRVLAWLRECPECGYELAGLPSRTCPECGCDAVEAAIARKAARDRRWKISRHTLVVPIAMVAVLVLGAGLESAEDGALTNFGAVAIMVLLLRWVAVSEGGASRANVVVWQYVVPVLLPLAIACVRYGPREWFGFVASYGLLAIWLAIGWSFIRERCAWRVLWTLGSLCTTVSLIVGVRVVTDVVLGRSWSNFSVDIGDGERALLNRQMLPRVALCVAGGVCVLAAAMVVRRRGARRQAGATE